ncbi:Receptor-like protein [Drosera capensis]
MYFMRLHFCEHLYSKTNQRVFYIYINNQTVVPEGADVIAWTGAKDVPTYKDYAIFVPNTTGDAKLWIALHPKDQNNGDAPPEFYDAILNGLEIFKVNDANKNLAGPNPTPSDALLKAEESQRKDFKNDNKANIKVIGAASGAAAFGIAAVVCIAMYQKKTRYPRSKSGTTSWLPIYGASTTQGGKSTIGGSSVASAQLSSEAAANCRHFSLQEIKKATKNFDESHVIGVGGFGKVYRGTIDGTTKVAIKRSNPSSEQGVNEFVTEIEMLSKLRHKHLVSLIGYCEEDGEMALVYDYMAHGTLREHLYKGNKINLTWKQRLEILIGAAKGLHYLHTGAKYTIIHRDVKTTNILLDEQWVAKVSDFGLSKTGPEVNQSHVSTVVKGSFGYLDPEYFRRQQLTEKSDVYSFGVVLFEVLCARPALNPSLPKEQVSLADWALLCARKGTIEDLIDPHIKGTIKPECLKKFVDTAQKCLSDQGVDRPSMSDLLWNLEFALQLQESNGEESKRGSPGESIEPNASANISKHYSTLSLGSEDDFVTDNAQNSSTAIFSQIVHPTGR